MSPLGPVRVSPELRFQMSFLSPGAIDLAAKSAGIIPGSPLPVLDAEGLSGISPLSSDEVTPTVPGQDSTSTHQNGDSIPAVRVSMFSMAFPHSRHLLGQVSHFPEGWVPRPWD